VTESAPEAKRQGYHCTNDGDTENVSHHSGHCVSSRQVDITDRATLMERRCVGYETGESCSQEVEDIGDECADRSSRRDREVRGERDVEEPLVLLSKPVAPWFRGVGDGELVWLRCSTEPGGGTVKSAGPPRASGDATAPPVESRERPAVPSPIVGGWLSTDTR
jgi:hypothetical protein